MKTTSRLIVYLLINIIVSALTTLTVLWIWERSHPNPAPQAAPLPLTLETTPSAPTLVTPSQTVEPTSEATIAFSDEIEVVIRAIVGVGNLDAEYVELYNQSPGKVDLTGWILMDEDGHDFIFPPFILNSDGAIKVLSQTGANNSVIELYWNQDAPLWESGEVATLVDASGNAISTYIIP